MKSEQAFNDLDNCDPRNCISGKVMRINRITANVFRKYLSPFNISDSQLTLLFVLAKRGGMTQKELSEMLRLEKSSLSRNLNRLIDNGYISKVDFPIVKITLEGKILANKIVPEWQKAMNEIKELLLDDGEEALDIVLNKLSSSK